MQDSLIWPESTYSRTLDQILGHATAEDLLVQLSDPDILT